MRLKKLIRYTNGGGGEKLELELHKNYLFTRLPNLEGPRRYFFACWRRHVLKNKMAPSIVKIILLNEMTKSKYSIISKAHNIKKHNSPRSSYLKTLKVIIFWAHKITRMWTCGVKPGWRFFFFKFVTVNNNVSTSSVAFFAFMIGNFILNKVVNKSYTALKVTRKK